MAKGGKDGEVIEFPENYEDMIEKLREREDELLQRALAKRKADTAEELKKIASTTIVRRQLRSSGEHSSLKDRTVLKEPKSEEVNKLRDQLEKETAKLAEAVLAHFADLPNQLSSLKKKLKGRVRPGGFEPPTSESQGSPPKKT